MNKSGIYQIRNILTNHIYLGSSKNIEYRFNTHKSLLRHDKHHSTHLQRAWNKYKEELFLFEIIELCNIEELLLKEKQYLDKLKPRYNISLDSFAPMTGRKHSKSTLEKFKGKRTGKLNGMFNRNHTEKSKKKMSDSKKGTKWTEEQRIKIMKSFKENGGYWKGKKVPEHITNRLVEYGKSIRNKIECSNGKIYDSQFDAAKDLNIRQGHISEHLQGKRPNVKGYTFKKI